MRSDSTRALRTKRSTPSFKDLVPSSPAATRAARGSSRKRDTLCERELRKALRRMGLRYSIAPAELVGRPDLVFLRPKVAVFCDGDFWHGKDLDRREARLRVGHNGAYWIEKIRANVARDQRQTRALRDGGWLVLRFWESEIRKEPDRVAADIAAAIGARRHGKGMPSDRSAPIAQT